MFLCLNGDLVMGKLEEESSSGLDGPDSGQFWNIMHGFWLRFFVAAMTISVAWIMYVRMSMYGVTTSMIWGTSVLIVLSAIAWIGVGK